jgi:hypothetical protein
VASGLQRWRAAVSSTTVNLIQRRLAGADGVSGSNTSSKNGAALSQSSGGSSSEAGAEADVGSRRPRGRSMPGSSLAAAAAVGSLTTAGSSCTGRGSGELQLRRQLGQVCELLSCCCQVTGLLPSSWGDNGRLWPWLAITGEVPVLCRLRTHCLWVGSGIP